MQHPCPHAQPDVPCRESSQLGARVEVRLQATELTVRYGGQEVERLERVVGREARIDYRHLIHSLVRKPGAFRRYVYREQLYPSLTFRRAYDALVADAPRRADLEYLRILHLVSVPTRYSPFVPK